MFVGPQLLFDPVSQRADLAFDGTDLLLDLTPATTMMVAVGSDRRAHPDDTLPDVSSATYAPSAINPRGGYPGDAFDPLARVIGSRLWLYRRSKQDEPTRRGIENAAAEALAFFETDHGMAVTVTVRWVRRNMAGILASLGAAQISLVSPVGA